MHLAQRAIKLRPGLRVVFMSGHIDPRAGHAALPAGAILLRKPFPPTSSRAWCAGGSTPRDRRDADPARVSALLAEARAGKAEALDALLPLVYHELRRVAGAYVRRERPGQRCRPPGWSTRPTCG